MPLVLIIEDSDEMRHVLSTYLSRMGYEIAEACDGLDGLKVAKARIPSLIILDLMMPVASGDFTLGFIRSTESLRHIPVIIASAHPRARAIAEKLDAACLKKPFGFPELQAAIERLGLPA